MPLSSFPPAPAQQASHRRGPGCVIEVDPVLAFPQEMRSTECGHGHVEVTEVFDAGHVQPGQATTHTDAGLVHIPDVESEAGEASDGRARAWIRPLPPCGRETRWLCQNSTGWPAPSLTPAPSLIS